METCFNHTGNWAHSDAMGFWVGFFTIHRGGERGQDLQNRDKERH